MRRMISRALAVSGMVLLVSGTLLAPGAAAHERWFTPGGYAPILVEDVFSLVTILASGVVAGVLGLAWLADRLVERRRLEVPSLIGIDPRGVANLYAWIPPLLALHAAVPLIVSGVELQLFVPNLPLPRNILGLLLALAQIVIALGFLYGAFTRASAILLALVGLAGMAVVHPLYVLEHCDLLGIAGFLFIAGRGPYSVDALLKRVRQPQERLLPYAVPTLRVLTGASLVVLGFTEKLWNRQLARDFLERNPLNFTTALPLTLTDDQFIIVAGLIEVTIGALIISGLWMRTVILLAWLPFNLSVPFFGWVELVGHLPTYGTMAVLLIWATGPHAEAGREAVRGDGRVVEVGEGGERRAA
jgi:uncharacterized membrane protein YphA (DoxX/SURF4 family)